MLDSLSDRGGIRSIVDALAATRDLAMPDDEAAVPFPPAWLREETSVLELRPDDNPRHLMRDEAAILLDRLIVRVARGRGAIDVAIGECLGALFDVEPRTSQSMARLARELRARPVLREPFTAGR